MRHFNIVGRTRFFQAGLSRSLVFGLGLLVCFGCGHVSIASEAGEVLVVFNPREHGSREIAEHYAERRGVPKEQVVELRMPVTESITRRQFVEEIQSPIFDCLSERDLWKVGQVARLATNGVPAGKTTGIVESKIRYLVLCRGVPLKISSDADLKEEGKGLRPEFQRNEAAVDSELACLPMWKGGYKLSGFVANPVYGVTNASMIDPTNGVLMVARLDGPTVEIALGLVDKAMEAETNGFWGRAYFDLRNPSEPGMKQGDDWIRAASEVCRMLGFETVLDERPGTFRGGFPMSQIAVYAGWYSANVDGPFLDEPVEFMPGALAYHLHSFSASSVRTTDSYWVGPLLERGATLSLGCVYEPYLGGTPDIGLLATRLYYLGFSYGEAAWACQSLLSWMTTVVGDPLFKPFRIPPQEIHERLVEAESPLVEWSQLRIVNLNLARGFPKYQAVAYLEEIPVTKQSAVLTEKLGDLYSELGKPASALRSWQAALDLNPSPKQKIRLELQLGEKLAEAGRTEDAIAMYKRLLDETRGYPDAVGIYRKLILLSEKMGDTAQTQAFQEAVKKLSGS